MLIARPDFIKILHFSVDLFRSVQYKDRYGILAILCYEEVVFHGEANE